MPMTTSNIYHQVAPPFPTACVSFQPPRAAVSIQKPPLKLRRCQKQAFKAQTNNGLKWAIQLSLVEQSPPKSKLDVQQLMGFLYEDLTYLFDDKGIDKTAYDERIVVRDPITKYDTLSGCLFNIALIRILFRPQYQLHWAKQGPSEITARWTVVMKFVLLPWKPGLVLTGTTIMGINPENGKFCTHVDIWDSTEKNEYFSFEGLWDVIKQLRIYKTLELESPKYRLLKRTSNYEIRQYNPFLVVETNGDKLSRSTDFNDIAGCIFGESSTTEKIPMTTPIFTRAIDSDLSKVSIQIVLPLDKETNSLPNPNKETAHLREVEGGIAAVMKLSGKPTEDIIPKKEKARRSNIIKDALKHQLGCLLARYNDQIKHGPL